MPRKIRRFRREVIFLKDFLLETNTFKRICSMDDALEHLPTILVVDDSGHDLELLYRCFREARLMNPVQTVCDGLEATRYLAGEGKYQQRQLYHLPGIVILDLLLPRMDGFEVLSWIRARRQFNNLPVIVLTGHAKDPNMEQAMRCGADGFLVKGADTDALIHLLRNAFLGWALVPTRTTDSRPAARVMR